MAGLERRLGLFSVITISISSMIGSGIFYLERTFGPLIGTVGGLGLFLSILLKASFALIGIGAYFSVFSSFPLMPTIMTFLVCIVFLNIFGVGKVSSFLTIILFVTIISLAALCAFLFPTGTQLTYSH